MNPDLPSLERIKCQYAGLGLVFDSASAKMPERARKQWDRVFVYLNDVLNGDIYLQAEERRRNIGRRGVRILRRIVRPYVAVYELNEQYLQERGEGWYAQDAHECIDEELAATAAAVVRAGEPLSLMAGLLEDIVQHASEKGALRTMIEKKN